MFDRWWDCFSRRPGLKNCTVRVLLQSQIFIFHDNDGNVLCFLYVDNDGAVFRVAPRFYPITKRFSDKFEGMAHACKYVEDFDNQVSPTVLARRICRELYGN